MDIAKTSLSSTQESLSTVVHSELSRSAQFTTFVLDIKVTNWAPIFLSCYYVIWSQNTYGRYANAARVSEAEITVAMQL